jgi:hypothetical protein
MYHFENTFLDHPSHCYGRDGPLRFCIFGGHGPAKFRLLSIVFLNFGNIILFSKLSMTFKISQSPITCFSRRMQNIFSNSLNKEKLKTGSFSNTFVSQFGNRFSTQILKIFSFYLILSSPF